MKFPSLTPSVWAALALAVAAGSLVAQVGDSAARKPQLLAEALKARDEGDLQVAKEKYEALLAIDANDPGAGEGLAAVTAALAEATAKATAKPGAVTAPPASGALAEVAGVHEKLFAEVILARDIAQTKRNAGDYKGALELIDGAQGALAPVPTGAAQKLRESLALARQEILILRDAGGATAVQAEVKRLAAAGAASLGKQGDVVGTAESLIRKGTAESLDKALVDLEAAERELGPDSLTNQQIKARLKGAKGSALARRALLAMEARDITKANSLLASYAELQGKDDPNVLRLQREFAAKRSDPTYRNIDDLSPGVRVKDDKVNELLVKGRARYLYGDYQGALDAYREALQYQPNNSESKAYQIRIRQMLSENSGQWNRGVTKGKLLELLDETWKLPEVFNRENVKVDKDNGNDPVIDKMKSIQLPDGLSLRGQPLDRALAMLVQNAKTYDKDQTSLTIVPLVNNKEISIELAMGKCSVYQALDYICKKHGLSFTVVSGGIIEVREDTGDSSYEFEQITLTQGAVIKMTGQSASTTTPGGGAAVNPFGGAGGASAGPGDGNPQEQAIKSFLIRSGVPFDPPATFSFDGSNMNITHTRKSIDRVKNILRRYSDIKQVHIEAKFMEVEQKVLNELGVNWLLAGAGGTVTARTQLRSLNSVFRSNNSDVKDLSVIDSAAPPPLVIPLPAPSFPGGINLGNSGTAAQSYINSSVGIIGQQTLSVAIRAIEESAGSDLMSSPSLTVLDSKTAVIRVAQLLRYPQAYGDVQSNVGTAGTGQAGGSSTSVAITAGTPQDFTVQEVGVTLEVTPTVNPSDDSINLNLKPKVTEFEGFVEYGGTSVAISGTVTVTVPSGFFQPIFSTREVTTEVTVFDGATVVIGGLTREEVKTIDDKVPVLGSIPIIGAAFRSTGKTIQKKSLMVFVTANLVSPGGATVRQTFPGMRAGATFSNPTLISPGGAVYREPIEVAVPLPVALPAP